LLLSFTLVLYAAAAVLLLVSFLKSREKTKKSLMKAWKSFENILPQLLGILMLVGLTMALMDPALVSRLIGGQSGFVGVVLSALVGAVTLVPGFIAFPTAALLLQHGAGYAQIGAFVSALMMVGVVTFPLERQYFGTRLSLVRNGLAFAFTFLVAFVLGWVHTL
jgi:uncharacterized membrane protein YraQ (UPF0718 family)